MRYTNGQTTFEVSDALILKIALLVTAAVFLAFGHGVAAVGSIVGMFLPTKQ